MKLDSDFSYDTNSIAWSVALAATAILGTLASSCMMPFVAIAVLSAATMTRANAAITIFGVWAIDQILGFGVLGYPWTVFALGWGAALLVASLIAMLVAATLLRGLRTLSLWLCAGFAAAFAAYEGVLYLFALIAGGASTFTSSIISSLLRNDAAWFVGLVALHIVLTRAAPRIFGNRLAFGGAS